MIDKIYGNKFAMDTFSSMLKSGRIPHSFLIYGEKGLGKKLLADYLAMSLLCEKGEDKPCGECHSCKMIKKHIHPDVIYPQQSGKLNTYTVEECRHICSDAFVTPNDGNRKIYIFADADNIQLPAQNTLLKIVEEPPDPVYFIFTSESKDAFLPTIISRVTSVGASLCSEDDCISALAHKGYESNQIQTAVEVFGGNIGMCVEYIENPLFQTITALTKKAIDSIINKDEYSMLTVFSSAEFKERSIALLFLKLLDRTVRDAPVLRYNNNANLTGCYKIGAMRLSEKISIKVAIKIHNCIEKAATDIKSNVSMELLMSALCGEIMDS